MVSLVIVSHSTRVAEGVRELAEQVTRGRVRVVAAGAVTGTPPGTCYDSVRRALETVANEDGALVLVDLGSAILTTQMALEDLPAARRRRILLCEAPLVEGAVAAAALLAAGASVEEAAAEARGALMPKMVQMGVGPAAASGWTHRPDWDAMAMVTVTHPLGLHAEPAGLFVQAASRYQSDVRVHNVTRNTRWFSAKSMNNVSLLNVRRGQEIAIAASGPDAATAVSTLKRLVESDFASVDASPPASAARPHCSPPHPVGPGPGAAVRDAIAFVQAHYSKPLTTAGVAERVFFHPRYFCTVFKAYTGVSFVEYLTRVRLARARDLLTRTDLDVSDVASRVGFKDPNYFSRVFKRSQGLSPREFRRQYCAGLNPPPV